MGFQGCIAVVTPMCLMLHLNPSLALFPPLRLTVVKRWWVLSTLGMALHSVEVTFIPSAAVSSSEIPVWSQLSPSTSTAVVTPNFKQNVPAFSAEVIHEHIKWIPKPFLEFSAWLLWASTSCSAILMLAHLIIVSSENRLWLSWIRRH